MLIPDNVRELISWLETADPDARVFVRDKYDEPQKFVVRTINNSNIEFEAIEFDNNGFPRKVF